MKVAFFHNPKAGAGNLQAEDVIRLLQDDGHQVLYVSIKDKNWERVFGEPIDRAIVAGGDGTVSRLAPWLAGTNVPFCILPLGTANNCARSLDQMRPVEESILIVAKSGESISRPSGTVKSLKHRSKLAGAGK